MGEVVIRTNFWLILLLVILYVFVGSGLMTLLVSFHKEFVFLVFPFGVSYFWVGWRLADIYY